MEMEYVVTDYATGLIKRVDTNEEANKVVALMMQSNISGMCEITVNKVKKI